jgi:hypothetical protein
MEKILTTITIIPSYFIVRDFYTNLKNGSLINPESTNSSPLVQKLNSVSLTEIICHIR